MWMYFSLNGCYSVTVKNEEKYANKSGCKISHNIQFDWIYHKLLNSAQHQRPDARVEFHFGWIFQLSLNLTHFQRQRGSPFSQNKHKHSIVLSMCKISSIPMIDENIHSWNGKKCNDFNELLSKQTTGKELCDICKTIICQFEMCGTVHDAGCDFNWFWLPNCI